jgi:hypothetical protein
MSLAVPIIERLPATLVPCLCPPHSSFNGFLNVMNDLIVDDVTQHRQRHGHTESALDHNHKLAE